MRIRKLSVSLTGTSLYCAPEVYLDGLFQRGAADLLDELLTPNQVRAIEVYRGAETPPQFIQGLDLPCGAIVLWTKG